MKKIIILVLFSIPLYSFANIEEDKNAGTCAMYLVLAQKSNIPHGNYSPNEALAMADKQSRAIQYSKMYADRIRDYQSRKQNTSPLINEGVKSCYDLGFKLSR